MSNKTKMWIAIYASWLILNVSCFFLGENLYYPYRRDLFFPFECNDLMYYDFGEFCVYALLLPAAIAGVYFFYKCLKERKQ